MMLIPSTSSQLIRSAITHTCKLKSRCGITLMQAGTILFFSSPSHCNVFRINWDKQMEPNSKLRLLGKTWSESLVIKLLESFCAICFKKYQLKWIYFSLESWFVNSSLYDLGISLKSFGTRCSCSVAWWVTDGPISCSRSESATNEAHDTRGSRKSQE